MCNVSAEIPARVMGLRIGNMNCCCGEKWEVGGKEYRPLTLFRFRSKRRHVPGAGRRTNLLSAF